MGRLNPPFLGLNTGPVQETKRVEELGGQLGNQVASCPKDL